MKQEQEANVWRISDVVRGARSLIIALSKPNSPKSAGVDGMALRQWGKRVWTLPEVLLISSKNDIRVYARSAELDAPVTHPR